MIGGRPATLATATGCFLLAENETFDQTWHYRSHLKTAMKMGLLSWFFMLYVPTALCEWTFSHKLAKEYSNFTSRSSGRSLRG